MIARRHFARASDPPRFRENAPRLVLRRSVVRLARGLWRIKSELAIAAVMACAMEESYQEERAAEQRALQQAEADRDGVVELVQSMIHKPPGYSVALSAATADELAERLRTARHVVLADRHR